MGHSNILGIQKMFNDLSSTKFALVRERRAQCSKDAKEECIKHNLSEEEAKSFCSSADSNAIWDAQANQPYRKPIYAPKPAILKVEYSELGFLTSKEQESLFRGEGLPARFKN